MTEDQTTATTMADDPTPHASETIPQNTIKINGKATPVVLRQFSKLKQVCPNKHGDLCLADFDNPQDCKLGICPTFQIPLKQRAAFLELLENGR